MLSVKFVKHQRCFVYTVSISFKQTFQSTIFFPSYLKNTWGKIIHLKKPFQLKVFSLGTSVHSSLIFWVPLLLTSL